MGAEYDRKFESTSSAAATQRVTSQISQYIRHSVSAELESPLHTHAVVEASYTASGLQPCSSLSLSLPLKRQINPNFGFSYHSESKVNLMRLILRATDWLYFSTSFRSAKLVNLRFGLRLKLGPQSRLWFQTLVAAKHQAKSGIAHNAFECKNYSGPNCLIVHWLLDQWTKLMLYFFSAATIYQWEITSGSVCMCRPSTVENHRSLSCVTSSKSLDSLT